MREQPENIKWSKLPKLCTPIYYKACKKEGIKPIIGCEVYVQPNNKKKLVRDEEWQYINNLGWIQANEANVNKLM